MLIHADTASKVLRSGVYSCTSRLRVSVSYGHGGTV